MRTLVKLGVTDNTVTNIEQGDLLRPPMLVGQDKRRLSRYFQADIQFTSTKLPHELPETSLSDME